MQPVRLQLLLDSPDLRGLKFLAGDRSRQISAVRMVDNLADLRTVPPGGIAIVLPGASAQAQGHHFDVVLRETAAAGAAAVVLTGVPGGFIEPTALRIADRCALGLLLAAPATDPTGLVTAVFQALTGDATDALARIDDAHRLIMATESIEGSAATGRHRREVILAAASEALGTPVRVRRPEHGEPAAQVLIEGALEDYVTAEVPDSARGAWVVAARAVVQLAADAYARVVSQERRTELAPIQDRGRLLGELLLAPESERVPLVSRARALGLPVDGWHQVLRFELSSSLDDAPAAVGADQVEAVSRAVLGSVRDDHGGRDSGNRWHITRIGSDLLLVRSVGADPGPAAARTANRAATVALGAAHQRFPGLVVRCGIGGVHRRAEGLRSSATDAKAALVVGRQARPPRDVVAIDALGLNRMLVEWYASDTTRASVDDLLEPLVELGSGAAEEAIRTLQAYLDQQSSPAKAAEVLRIHRQTVNYRLRKISNLLSVDLQDPEQRLALQLACRAWLMR